MGGWVGGLPRGAIGLNGGVNVNISTSSAVQAVNEYHEITSVPSNAETTIVQYLVPLEPKFTLLRVEFTGDNIATYRLYIGTSVQAKEITWFNGPMSDSWDFSAGGAAGLIVSPSTVIRVTAIHTRPMLGSFAARILGVLG